MRYPKLKTNKVIINFITKNCPQELQNITQNNYIQWVEVNTNKIHDIIKNKHKNTITNNKQRYKQAVINKNKNLREFLDNYKLQHPCKCGCKNINCLCFHHIDKNQKQFNVSDVAGKTQQKLEKQILKCEVLCINCHLIHHYDQIHKQYNNYNMNGTKNRDKRKRKKKNDFIKQYLSQHPCVNCGCENYKCLQFHHINSQTKLKNISDIKNIQPLKKQIQKCVVLCGNCHQIEHNKQKRKYSNL